MIIVVLLLLGLCFGSFVNAMVWRVHEKNLPAKKRKASVKDLSITKGRSMCVHCGHTLSTVDLIPVFSWILLRGRCRYCKKPISRQYPLVELITAALFILSYIFWPNELKGPEIVAFGLWLASIVGFMALIVYDIRWMLLPNKIIFPMYLIAVAFILAETINNGPKVLLDSSTAILIGGGLFYILFQVSDGRWIGGGDVKLGFLLGALLGDPVQALMMIFVASLLGTLYILPLMLVGKTAKGARIPFGPFLIAGAILVQLFGAGVTDWYTLHFIDV